ncbi:MAG: alpha-ketoacid dehydrogenase subunit beta [Actinobacteria bacterium]|nr:alpha-ketoacid dehydrogenase subunit beta [Actinomycetota bacterium]
MRRITYKQAIKEAIREEMLNDEKVFIFGEDVAVHGGAFFVTTDLLTEFGPERVLDTPISEVAIVGLANGSSIMGLRPIAEIMFNDFLCVGMDQVVNQMAKMRYMSGGQLTLPLVIRTAMGAGLSAAAQHSQCLEALFMHIPGIKIIVPSTPYDAKGLLKSAIRDNNPVMFFEHVLLYPVEGEVPEDEYTIPLGQADIKRKGNDVTIVAIGLMVQKALSAAEKLENESIEVEIIDPRSLSPLDFETVLKSVKKTKRVVIAYSGSKTNGSGTEIAARLSEEGLQYLKKPVFRVAAKDAPIPFAPKLEKFVIPQEKDIYDAVINILK